MSDAQGTVFVIDDDPSVRTSVARLLRAAGLQARLFAGADDFFAQIPPDAPACVLLDMRLPGSNGLEVQEALAKRQPGLPVVFITGHGDIPMTVRAMKAGAVNFLTKPFHHADLLHAVREALARHRSEHRAAAEAAEVQRRAQTLSPREFEVMKMVVRGLLNKQAGQRLGIGEKTIKVHRARVMQKMGADSLADLVRMAEKINLGAAPDDGTWD